MTLIPQYWRYFLCKIFAFNFVIFSNKIMADENKVQFVTLTVDHTERINQFVAKNGMSEPVVKAFHGDEQGSFEK